MRLLIGLLVREVLSSPRVAKGANEMEIIFRNGRTLGGGDGVLVGGHKLV